MSQDSNVSNHARLIFDSVDHKLTKFAPQDAVGLARQLQLASPEAQPSSLQSQYLTIAGSHESGTGQAGSGSAVSLFLPAILLPADPIKADEATSALSQNDLPRVLSRNPQLE